jgi:iron complex outermembrane receptor protein
MIEQVVDEASGAVGFRNTSNARVHGVELEGEYVASGGVRLRTSVSHEDADDSDGNRLTNSPAWLAKLHATTPVPATSLRAALELQAMGPRITEAGATLGSQVLTNLSLGWNSPGRRWSASLSVTNLFDRKVFDPNGTEYVSDRSRQDGREATLRFYVSF